MNDIKAVVLYLACLEIGPGSDHSQFFGDIPQDEDWAGRIGGTACDDVKAALESPGWLEKEKQFGIVQDAVAIGRVFAPGGEGFFLRVVVYGMSRVKFHQFAGIER